MHMFCDAALALHDYATKDFVLQFSRFYYHQCYKDDSPLYEGIKEKLKFDEEKGNDSMNRIKGHFTNVTTTAINAVLAHLKEGSLGDDGNLIKLVGNNGSSLTSSFFMHFVFFFDDVKKSLIHWPVSGPVGFNCRIIKHDLLDNLNKRLQTEKDVGASESAYIVPFKVTAENSPGPGSNASAYMCSMFSEMNPSKPEFEHLRASVLESNEIIAALKIFIVSASVEFGLQMPLIAN